MDKKVIQSKLLQLKKVLEWQSVGKFRDTSLYLSDITSDSVSYWGYPPVGEKKWKLVVLKWSDITDAEYAMFEKFVALKFPKEYKVTKESYLIDFLNEDSKETLQVNLKDKKFTKIYATGKTRDVKYPNSFFKGMDGRVVSSKIPSDNNFKKLVDVIIKKEHGCSNFGTFLIRLFDNIHLETYISAGVEFDTQIKVGYDFFDKDVRNTLNKHKMRYNNTVEQFFANNHDLGKSMLHFIKDAEDFQDVFYGIAKNMRDINVLVENYKYDVKSLFTYCTERNWNSGRNTYNRRDLIPFICDYARMAELVFPNGFDKYPKDIIDHHDGVTKLYAKEKVKFDDVKYQGMIDKKMEYETKEFSMIYPTSTGLIQEEGRILSHCVGSYINSILSGHTTIMFMRKKEELDTPLVTVEVRDGRIAQARGKYNRSLAYEENEFLKEYAEKKKLSWK